ncbi:DUF1573 domain-containing protein [Flavobacterium magnum]|uniref:DUF1573 domain-containing protein n=1 Tax=Flavobacterium magnum TaxID=2162713 RepID=A0A2S0RCC7_9FLAO|nr:DUF1573 domain-containing protein [Flavobacterium magnum]AWA28898.1 DUF1573 domain-containing protein [Flavobacterium magnum]
MKKNLILFSAMALFAVNGAFAQETGKKALKKTTTTTKTEMKKTVAPMTVATPAVEGAGMTFETETIDYGTIKHNADGKREFVLTNTGNKPLTITNCAGSCGCTVPTWPKEPIAPGAKAVIGVKYATDRVGPFTKTVTVTSNASETPKVLTIKGTVLADPTPAETPTKS